ncbi:MAG: hypothetical protein K2K38_01225 [Clostridia bacterium]|nr:hypothetical protein [Clostridia bacterium]
MDRICIAVLDKICSLAAFGRFVVFSEDELFDAFPDGEERREGVLKSVLKSLKEDGFIDLKYSSGNLYCIAPIKRYEPTPEIEIIPPEIEEKVPKVRHIRGAIFISAFFGGALGSLVISLIFALI